MKTITIIYDDSKIEPTLGVQSQGFTDAEAIIILEEARNKVKDAIVDGLKKKSTGIITPHLMHPSIT